MGYVITAGIGLSLGLGLLVWALRLQGKLAEAVQKMAAEKARADAAHRVAEGNVKIAESAIKDAQRIQAQVAVLRATTDELRKRLVACQDPETIKTWLDETLKEEVV